MADVEFGTAEIEGSPECKGVPNVGDYILVQIATKKLKKNYVAQIIEIHNDSFAVKYLKKSLFGTNFYCHSDMVYELPQEDVIMKFGKPVLVGGTARKSAEIKFSVDLSSFNIE